jgi:hypothetical protein
MPRILPPHMLDAIFVFGIAILIVMPVVAILLMGLQRALRATWPPRAMAIASVAITAVVVIAYWVLA